MKSIAQIGRKRKKLPCNPGASTCPWRRAKRSSRQSRAGRKQPRPKQLGQHTVPTKRFAIAKTYHSEILKRTSRLDILQRLLEVLQLGLDLTLGLLSVLHSLGLKGIDSLQLAGNIVGGGLEALEVLLDLVDDGLVLEHTAVVREVDGLRLLGQNLHLAAGVVVALLEGLQRCGGLAAEAERGRDLGPVDLESGTALLAG